MNRKGNSKLAPIFFVLILIMSTNIKAESIINVIEMGADNTGQTLCTDIVKKTIDSLSSQGGGEVYFPAGSFLCGPIEIKSNITLNIEAGATLKFSDNFELYLPMIKSRWEGIRVNTFKSAIYAHNAANITIKGRGTIDGNGKKWWDYWYKVKNAQVDTLSKWEKVFQESNKELIKNNAYIQKMGNFLRPTLFMPYECSNVRIEGVTFKNPAFWTIMPTFSENITIDGITIINPEESPNTDGIDPSSCKNVRISNSHISVGDDCIVIKSGRDEDGREAACPTENVTISNCTMLDGHGGVVIGSEMSGGVRRITISNCVFMGTDRGIRIKTMRGRGGFVEDICISNIVMYDILKQGIMFNMRYHETEQEEVSERTPTIRNISISNIRINKAKQAIAFFGLEERSIKNISIKDVNITAQTGIFGEHAKGIELSGLHMEISNGVPVMFKNAQEIQIRQLTVNGQSLDEGAIKLTEVNGVLIADCFQCDSMPYFLDIDEKSEKIYLIDNVLPGVNQLTKNVDKRFKNTNTILAQ